MGLELYLNFISWTHIIILCNRPHCAYFYLVCLQSVFAPSFRDKIDTLLVINTKSISLPSLNKRSEYWHSAGPNKTDLGRTQQRICYWTVYAFDPTKYQYVVDNLFNQVNRDNPIKSQHTHVSSKILYIGTGVLRLSCLYFNSFPDKIQHTVSYY